MLTPIELIKATVDGMMARKFGRIVNITSAAVKAPIEVLGLSNGARAGLTGFVAGISRKTVIDNVTINGLLPGPFDTDRLRGTAKAEGEKRGITGTRSWRNAPNSIPLDVSAIPRNSAWPARSSAAPRPLWIRAHCSPCAPGGCRSGSASRHGPSAPRPGRRPRP